MKPPLPHIIILSETFLAHIKAAGKQPCSAPVLLDLTALGDNAGLDETHSTAWLSEQERCAFHHFKLIKRKKEWLAGRICAKIAIKDYFRTNYPEQKIPASAELSIINSKTGRPLPTWNNGERLHKGLDISISHSGNLALALAAQTCCGVDIQNIKESLARVKERFCTNQEECILSSALRENSPLMHLTLLWAAKEAAKKALSITEMPGFLDLVLDCIERVGEEEHFFIFRHSHRLARSPLEIRVVTTCHQNYALGICIP